MISIWAMSMETRSKKINKFSNPKNAFCYKIHIWWEQFNLLSNTLEFHKDFMIFYILNKSMRMTNDWFSYITKLNSQKLHLKQ